MNVSLTPEVAAYVEAELAGGDYGSANEVVRDALQLMRREREVADAKLRMLREAVSEGAEAAERNEFATRSVREILDDVLAGRGA